MKTMTQLLMCVLLACALSACASDDSPQPPQTGRTASFDGLEIAYDAQGGGDPTIVFIHGWCCDRTHWAAQMAALDEAHRVVALDLGGQGESGIDRDVWTTADLARDVVAVVEHLDLNRVVLVGHSMGGPVSLQAAAMMPDRVIGVIGVDTLQDVALEFTEEMMAPFVAALEADFAGVCAGFLQSMLPEWTDPALVDRITEGACATDPKVGVGLMRSYITLDQKAILAACPVPVRCINAAAPNETKVESNRRFSPSFDVVLMEEVGHFPMLEKPDEFTRLLREQVAALAGN
ncbi:MAG: alpha/beta hydrolase [Phycisphaerales bacterium]|nr:alpha/beta hydrolase [Phycisphaerales bacterium]